MSDICVPRYAVSCIDHVAMAACVPADQDSRCCAAQAGVPVTIMNMGRTQYDSIAKRLISEPIQDALPRLVDETIAAHQGE